MSRTSGQRMALGMGLLLGLLLLGTAAWGMGRLFGVDSGTGTALGATLRTEGHVATLISALEPAMPSLHRDPAKDRYRLSLLLVPLDGSPAKLFLIKRHQPVSAFRLAKVLGSDGRVLWFDAAGIGGVDLRRLVLLSPEAAAMAAPNPLPRPWGALPVPPRPDQFLATGLFAGPARWLGLHSDDELARSYSPGRFVRPVESAAEKRIARRLYLGRLSPDPVPGSRSLRILSMDPVDPAVYYNAAFLRPGAATEPTRLERPPGVLMLYASDGGLQSTAVLARVDTEQGRVVWTADTGIHRFLLSQILPGATSTALVGTRPPIPGKVSEPLLVIVDHATGALRTESLWR